MLVARKSLVLARLAPVGVACVLVLLVNAQPAYANVYAAHLSAPDGWNPETMGALTLTYRLNEPASSVSIEIFRASQPGTVVKTLVGTTDHGLNSVQWDGSVDGGGQAPAATDYTFRVIAEDTTGHEAWENITPRAPLHEVGSAQYAAPQGIAVNRDPNSEFFGRVYVLNADDFALSFNPGATAVGDGLFMLTNDMAFVGGTAATAAAPANAALDTDILSTESPWRLQINPDNSDELVLGDLSDGFENVWIFNAAGTSAQLILDRTTTGPGTGIAQNHGNSFDVMITGTGGGRKLWIIDEDYDLNGDIQIAGPDISVFFIGTVMEDCTDQPWEVINGGSSVPGAAGINYTARAFDRGASSDLYVVNQRYNPGPTELALSRYDLDALSKATSAVWSLSNDDITADPVVTASLGIQWSRTFAVVVDEARGIGAAGRTDGGHVIIFDTVDGEITAAFDSGGPDMRDLAFDAVGNLYTTNETDQHVRTWSPPDGPNSYTTTYIGEMNIGPDASPDCNENSVPDETDIVGGTSADCNTNGIPDECDIDSGLSLDLNGNGVPDECDVPLPVILAPPADGDTVVTITAIEPEAVLVQVFVDGTTNGSTVPGGETTVDIAVPALSMGQVVTAKTILEQFESDLSEPEIVTTSGLGAVVICDDFEYGDQGEFDTYWTAETDPVTNEQLVLSTDQNSTFGGVESAWAPSTDRCRSKAVYPVGVFPTSTHPLVWTVSIYDESAGSDVNQYADLNVDLGVDFFLAEVGMASPYFTGNGEPETHYQARVVGKGGPGWFHLDAFGAPRRSVGWHQFSVVFKGHHPGESTGHYIDIYVDAQLAVKNVHIFDDVVLEVPRIGSGQDSATGAYFDDYCARVGPVRELALYRDCNANGVNDVIDVSAGTSADCNSNGIPDECDADCNTNGVPDDCDIASGYSNDCDQSGSPDECDIAVGRAADCNVNGSPDVCDVSFGDSSDCNTNGYPDECDLAGGTCEDCDTNGWPDTCDLHAGGQVAKLNASDEEQFRRFGKAVAIDGNFAVVGVPRAGIGGAGYVFQRVGGSWIERQILVASDTATSARFGQSVAIQGDLIVCGADGDADAGVSSGAAYVFRRDGATWVEEAKLVSENPAAGDQFGYSVAIGGEYILIGAYLDDDAALNAGSVYVFAYSNGSWVEQQELAPADIASGDLFAWSLAADGDRAVIGSMRDDDGGGDSGSAYVFVNSNGTWVEEAKLVADDADASDMLGFSCSISGPCVLVGAYGEDGVGFDSGSVYAFVNSNGTWVQEAKLLGADTVSFDAFGVAVSVSGDYAAIGARGDDDAGAGSGSVYLFHRRAGSWYEAAKYIAEDADRGDQYGGSVALTGNDFMVGAEGNADAGGYTGAAYCLRVPVTDCDASLVLDKCEALPDCNVNGYYDACETIGAGDFDADGDVDMVDFAQMVDCFCGPDGTPAPTPPVCPEICPVAFDFDSDGDIDLADFAGFQEVFGG